MNIKTIFIFGIFLCILISFQSFGREKTPELSREILKAKIDSIRKIKSADIVSVPEKFPEFPGGIKAFYNYINENLQYPTWEKENNIQGRVTATFIVEKDGSITNIEILRTVTGSKNLGTETTRLLQNMPKWIPAKQGGEDVRSRYTVPIMFSLDKQ